MTKGEKFYFAFQQRIDHYNNLLAKDDPYGIATAMAVALTEVRSALMASGLLDTAEQLPVEPSIEREPPRDRHLPGTELPLK